VREREVVDTGAQGGREGGGAVRTSARASRAAKARMSAQETTPKQACSSRVLALSITSNPRRLAFGAASFSAWLPAVESSRTDPSHPCNACVVVSTTQLAISQ
jgi:hypothetical protein